MHKEEHIYTNKNRDNAINLLDNIFRLDVQRRKEEFYNDTWNLNNFTKYQQKKSGQNSVATKDPDKTCKILTRAAKSKKWFPVNVLINQTLLFQVVSHNIRDTSIELNI